MTQKITFGICTYNRKDILIKSAKSLSLIDGLSDINIRIYDDCSTEYDEEFLRNLFPYAKSIIRHNANNGADKNTSMMYEDFLKSGDDWLFNADSDLIYRKDILNTIEHLIDKCDGFITLFNCINHKTIGKDDNFEKKESVGSAGCLIRRDVVEEILNKIEFRDFGFDVSFSKLLVSQGKSLYATPQSYVQHIGVSGFNSRDIKFDYGIGFKCDSLENAEIIEDAFEEYIVAVQKYRETPSWKAFNFIVSIPRRIKKIGFIIKKKLS